jgi:hypothetical protein
VASETTPLKKIGVMTLTDLNLKNIAAAAECIGYIAKQSKQP